MTSPSPDTVHELLRLVTVPYPSYADMIASVKAELEGCVDVEVALAGIVGLGREMTLRNAVATKLSFVVREMYPRDWPRLPAIVGSIGQIVLDDRGGKDLSWHEQNALIVPRGIGPDVIGLCVYRLPLGKPTESLDSDLKRA